MDPYAELARMTIDHFTRFGKPPAEIPEAIRQALAGLRAATFVGIHGPDGELRGCKGTLEPWWPSVEEEIVHNAISACSRDTRFAPVREAELEGLEVHVDVLSPLEPIQGPGDLDPKRYGIVVSVPDGRRGVLLPDLETIDTVEDQIAIACRKAGIDPRREALSLARFTTVRHR